MLEFFYLTFFGLFCIIIQSSFVLDHFVFPVKPDLTIPLTIYLSLCQKQVRGALFVLWIGFLMDLFSGGIVGLYMFLRGFLFFLIQLLRKILFLENRVFCYVLVIIFFILDSSLFHLIFGLGGKSWEGLGVFLKTTLVQAIFSLFLSILLFPIFYKLEKFIKRTY